jgi:hypothetical protein
VSLSTAVTRASCFAASIARLRPSLAAGGVRADTSELLVIGQTEVLRPTDIHIQMSLTRNRVTPLKTAHAPPSHAQENNPRNSHSLATTPWFTITGTHMFITSGTSTVMTQHHLHHVDGSTPTAPHCL